MDWLSNVSLRMMEFLQRFGIDLSMVAAVATIVATVFSIFTAYKASRSPGRSRDRISRYFVFGQVFGSAVAVGSSALLFLVKLGALRDLNILTLIDTPREVLVVIGSLALILCSIACTIYFRPARMTVIAGVALGFIGAVLFAEGVFAAHEYMNRRIDEDRGKLIEVPKPSLKTN